MKLVKIDGQLEIDTERGIVWFKASDGSCVLRICNLPRPIPVQGAGKTRRMLDIAACPCSCDWEGRR